jgi:ABC-type transporter Mla subunit MlaD
MDYTPPPWTAHAVNYINDTPAQWEIRDKYKGVIAVTESVNPDDAALIAAAPDLLEALQDISNYFGRLPDVDNGLDECLTAARAAINKATHL